MKKYGKALIWAAIIIAVALQGFDAGVTIALIAGISFAAIDSLFPGNRWTRGCWSCGSKKA